MAESGEASQQGKGSSASSAPAGTDAKPVREDARHATQPSGPKGDNPGTAGPGPTGVTSNTPENDKGRLNPSAPEDSNTTPGSTTDK